MCEVHQNNKPIHGVLHRLLRALVVAFGLVGIIFMAIHNLFSLKFFLIFSPIFIMYSLITMVEYSGLHFWLLNWNLRLFWTILGFWRRYLEEAYSIFSNFTSYLSVSTEVYYYFSCSGTDNPVLAWTSSMVLFGIGVLYLFLHFTVGNAYANDLK